MYQVMYHDTKYHVDANSYQCDLQKHGMTRYDLRFIPPGPGEPSGECVGQTHRAPAAA